MSHSVKWKLFHDGVSTEFSCDKPDSATCKQYCPEGCELYPCNHDLVTGRTCNIVDWLEQQSGEETYAGPETTPRDGEIATTWDGDGYSWSYAPLVDASCGALIDHQGAAGDDSSKLEVYRRALNAAHELLAACGWFPFGHHAGCTPVPDLEFWGHDDSGLPIFERRLGTETEVEHLRADNAKLAERLEYANGCLKASSTNEVQFCAELLDVKAENARLRAAQGAALAYVEHLADVKEPGWERGRGIFRQGIRGALEPAVAPQKETE